MEQYMELIIYLGLILIYIIARLLRGSQSQTDNEPRPEQSEQEARPQTPFDDFLREIRGEEEKQKPTSEEKSPSEETYEHPFSDKKNSQEEQATPTSSWEQKPSETKREERKPIKGTLEEKWGPLERPLTNETPASSQGGKANSYESYEKQKPFYNKAQVYSELLKNRQSARQSIVVSEILKPKHF